MSVTPDYLITGHEDKYIIDLSNITNAIANTIDEQEILKNIIPDISYFAEDEDELISSYRSLNEAGKRKVLEYISDLKTIEKYTSPDTELKRKLNA